MTARYSTSGGPARRWLAMMVLSSLTIPAGMGKGTGVGIYAIIDDVIFEEGLVKISGVFVVPVRMSSGEYQEPHRGFLLFRIPSTPGQAARKELEQLKNFAGTGEVVGFAYYWVPNPSDPGGNPHHSLEVKVRTNGDTSAPEIYALPFPGGVEKAGDADFDATVAQRLREIPQ